MEHSNFDQLLSRYLEGKVSDSERRKIEAWLEVRKTAAATDLELSKDDEERLFRKITGKQDNLQEIKAFLPGRRTRTGGQLIGMAAAVLILIVAGIAFWNKGEVNFASAATVQKLILTDGTLVWLQPGSKLSYAEKHGTRETHLEGEALFEVAKDPAHPFIIHYENVKIQVTGTSFSVGHNNSGIEVNVLTGNVQVSDANAHVSVAAKQKAIYRGGGSFNTGSLDNDQIAEITAGTEYNMVFTDQSLRDVLHRVGKKFDREIRIEGSPGTCRLTADFTDQSLHATLQMIKEVLEVEIIATENDIIVTGNSCL